MNPSMTSDKAPLISRRLVVGLVLISALSALGFLALSAYAPDLRSDTSSNATVLSRSAIGFAGLKALLDGVGIGVNVGREPPRGGAFSLVVLTPEVSTLPKDLAALAGLRPRLVVLPKWNVTPDPEHSGWVMKFGTVDPSISVSLLETLAKGAKIAQSAGHRPVGFKAVYARFAPQRAAAPLNIEALQTISGPGLEADVVDDQGRAVVVQIRGSQTYILSDPDILNNAGLHDLNTARVGTALIQALRVGDAGVSFDVTLNGFGRSRDLLRTVFSPPFLGATLCAILAAAFIAFHAMSRFGSPRRQDRAFAFGKRALADNTAAVIRMMRREPAMAPRYAQAALRQAAGFFGLSREQAADPSMIGALERRGAVSDRFANLQAEAASVRDAGGLMRIAKKLYRWRRDITHGHI